METNFEQKLGEQKYPEIEELVETELPQEEKERIAKLIFKDQLEGIKVMLKGVGLSFAGDVDTMMSEIDSTVKKIGQSSEQAADTLMSYFDEKVRNPLFAKFEELLLAAENDEVQNVKDWHKQAQEKAGELWKRWFEEINALADTYQNELIAKIKESGQEEKSE